METTHLIDILQHGQEERVGRYASRNQNRLRGLREAVPAAQQNDFDLRQMPR